MDPNDQNLEIPIEERLLSSLMGETRAVEAVPEIPAVTEPETPAAVAPVAVPPAARPAEPSALEATQAQLARLSSEMDRLVGLLGTERERGGERLPETPAGLAALMVDGSEEAKVIAKELLSMREQMGSLSEHLDAQIQERFDAQVDAEKASFVERYPGFAQDEVTRIDDAWQKAVTKNEALSELTFEEFAIRYLGGVDALIARRAHPTPQPRETPAPGGKPPARIVASSATGGGRASLGKPLDRHASQDDITARLTAALQATR